MLNWKKICVYSFHTNPSYVNCRLHTMIETKAAPTIEKPLILQLSSSCDEANRSNRTSSRIHVLEPATSLNTRNIMSKDKKKQQKNPPKISWAMTLLLILSIPAHSSLRAWMKRNGSNRIATWQTRRQTKILCARKIFKQQHTN